eukprot:g9745.t2
MDTPEKKSDYAKRVLFGGPKPAAVVTADKQAGGSSSRSGSHSSTSSAPSSAIYSVPGTPRSTTNGTAGASTPFMLRTPGGAKTSTPNNAALSVFLRVRPPGAPDADIDRLTGRRTYQILEDQATLRTFPPLSAGHSRTINRQAKDFGFTRVFSPAADQAETYESTMRPLVDDVFTSQNALLFAYGMTNAGKTYTVLGEDGSPGLIPQALTDTFERVAKMNEGGEAGVRVEMSFLEIYNENVFDLLAAADADDWAKARTALKLDDRMGVISARDLSKHVITSAAGGLDLVKRATANRRVASTRLNEDSSRSHSVCMEEPETRVPFRESKLTHLFKNHLQGPTAGKTVMVVNINPSTADFDETQQVLKNSTIAREVKTVKDDSAANRQIGLIHTPYGFNGRKMVVKKPQASRRSIHQAVAPKLEGLGPPPPSQSATQSPKRVMPSHGDTDCGSDGDVGRDQEEPNADGGYLSGAESDSGLVDTRQSMNLVVRNLQVDNAALKTKLKTTLADRIKSKKDTRGHQPISGGPLEHYICLLEDKVSSAEARMEEMRQEHQAEVRELEDEFESFLAENGLDTEEKSETTERTGGPQPSGAAPASKDAAIGAAVVERLHEEVRVANLQADQWKKEAETLRARLASQKEATGGNGGTGTTRSPLRQSTGSTGQGRPSVENRGQEDGENSPPGRGNNGAPAPGGVGSPPKNANRNTSASPKTKASALPSKKKKGSTSPAAASSATANTVTTTAAEATGAASSSGTSSKRDSEVLSERDAAGGDGGGSRVSRESKEGGGCWGSKGKVVVAVSRRVSVLRVSTAGSRRVSAVRASFANGRRASRASYAAGSRRVSHLTRSRASMANAAASANNEVSGDVSSNNSNDAADGMAAAAGEDVDDGVSAATKSSTGGLGSRRESAMLLAVQQEENFFEKARRCVLRAIGVGRKSTHGRSGSSRAGSIRGGGSPAVAETAEEIEQRHKIKVKMPKRPSKKAMEGVAGAGQLWEAEKQCEGTDSFEEMEEVEEVDDEDEEGGSSPTRTSTSAVMSGIERWVFGGKGQRTTPTKSPGKGRGKGAAAGAGATAEVSPVPGTTTMHDYVRAM